MEKFIIIETKKGKTVLPKPIINITERLPNFLEKVGHKSVKVQLVEELSTFDYKK